MDIQHFFHIPFLWRGPFIRDLEAKPEKFREWLNYRYKFMLDNTIQSLRMQTSPSPILIRVDDALRKWVDPVVEKFGLPEGCTIYGGGQPLSWVHANYDFDWVYLTRIDSDDLYHKDVAREVKATPPNWRTLLYRVGYLYDFQSKKIEVYNHFSGSTQTDIYSKKELKSGIYPKRRKHSDMLSGGFKVMNRFRFVKGCIPPDKQALGRFPDLVRQSMTQYLKDTRQYLNRLPSRPATLADFGCPHLKVSATEVQKPFMPVQRSEWRKKVPSGAPKVKTVKKVEQPATRKNSKRLRV